MRTSLVAFQAISIAANNYVYRARLSVLEMFRIFQQIYYFTEIYIHILLSPRRGWHFDYLQEGGKQSVSPFGEQDFELRTPLRGPARARSL